MSLITAAEVKRRLQISVSTYDTLIDELLPEVRDYVVYDLCQNAFKHPKNIYIEATTISFDESDMQILDSDSNFVENDFTSDTDIIVEGSISNDGLYEIDTAAAASLTLQFDNHPNGTLTDEAAGEVVRITRVDFRRGLKLAVAQLFSHLLDQSQLKGLASEQTGNYAVTFLNDIPKTLQKKFQPFKRLSW